MKNKPVTNKPTSKKQFQFGLKKVSTRHQNTSEGKCGDGINKQNFDAKCGDGA